MAQYFRGVNLILLLIHHLQQVAIPSYAINKCINNDMNKYLKMKD